MDLFDKYIEKEIFSNILYFLSKTYLISNKIICKNWNKILTSDFTKKLLNLQNKISYIDYYDFFRLDMLELSK